MILNKIFFYNLLILIRLNNPTGIFLLLWPTITALFFASNAIPDFKLILIFTTGTFLMRSAGCIANDLADQNIDEKVERTKNRPLVVKTVSNKTAFITLIFFLAFSLFLVLQLNLYSFYISLFALFSAILYPFSKRFFIIPQLFLGIAFSSGILMAFTATQNNIPIEGWLLFLANVSWVLAYDSHYALVDLEDDKRLTIYSAAKTFGKFTPFFIIFNIVLMYFIFFFMGVENLYSYNFYILIMISILISFAGVILGQKSISGNFKAFKINNFVGFFVFLAFLTQIV